MTADGDNLDLKTINSMLEASHPTRTIEWAAAQFGRNLVMVSSFGVESAVLIHLATRIQPDIPIIMVDTAFLFAETHAFMKELRNRFDLNVMVFRTDNDPEKYLTQAGEDDPNWRKDVIACCTMNKNEPFERAMKELTPQAWLRGIRRDQVDIRQWRQIVEWSPRYGCYAVSPLSNWAAHDIRAYMEEHQLPYHPLYEKGYLAIGCHPLSCTRKAG